MNKLHIAILIGVLIGQFRLSAQSTTAAGYGAEAGQPTVWTVGGVPVPDGNTAAIGYFDAGFDPMAAQNRGDFEALVAHWHPFDSTTVITDVGEGGHFSDQGTSIDPAFVDKQIWLFVFKTADNTAPDPDYADVRQYGLFSGTASNWRFRPLGSFPANRTDVYTSEVNTFAWGNLSGGHLNLAQVTIVPEPAIGALLAVGLGYLVLQFRGKNSK
jgi:hypothetical protein